ncbi:MAG: rhodanese-like domain-containing protein [Corynebacteriales bacterium]|nr:rhodanese-like domain-containing protein [Mycobacteriales bacterium]
MESTVILDVRVDALGRPDHDAHLRGHIPTARFVDLDVDLSGTVGPRSGARPLPEIDQLRASLRRWGITPATPVVVHDDSTSAAAARAWWVLRWAGVRDVRLLDGGLRSWIDAGGDIARGPRTAPRPVLGASRAIRPRPGGLPVVEIDDIVEVTRRAVLLDARPAEHFAGREGGAAHIPGAISAPVFDDFDDHGRLRPADELAARYRSLGVDLRRASPGAERADVVAATYCSSGVAAALQVLVLATLGVSAALYPGSLSQWISDPARLTVGSAITPRPTADIA